MGSSEILERVPWSQGDQETFLPIVPERHRAVHGTWRTVGLKVYRSELYVLLITEHFQVGQLGLSFTGQF